jgi:hypothetical protein
MKFSSAVVAVALVLVCRTVLLNGQTDAEVRARAEEANQALLKAHVAWETKVSSPGASIQAKEVEREGSVVRYNLYVSGLPTDRLYTAMSWPVGQPKPGSITDSNGNLRFALMPFVSGHGKDATTVKAVGMDCSSAVKFDWGS